MKIELEIKRILKYQHNPNKAASEICCFMNWKKKKVVKLINKHKKNSNKILEELWPNKNT